MKALLIGIIGVLVVLGVFYFLPERKDNQPELMVPADYGPSSKPSPTEVIIPDGKGGY